MADPESPESRRVGNKDRSFSTLKLHFLSIKINRCTDLAASDMSLKGSSSDPFVTVHAQDQSFTTKTIMKDLNPVFDEETTFCFFDKCDEIEFKVFDWDKNTKHDEIGCVKLATANFYEPNSDGFRGDLTLTNVKRGSINVTVRGRLILPKQLEDRVNSLQLIADDQIAKLETGRNELNALESALNQTKSENSNLKSEFEGLTVKMETLRMEEKSLKKNCNQLRTDIEAAKEDAEKAQKKEDAARKKKTKMEAEVENLKSDISREESLKHSKLERKEELEREVQAENA